MKSENVAVKFEKLSASLTGEISVSHGDKYEYGLFSGKLRRVVSQKLTDVSFQRSLLFPSSAP
jgi:hypothetical protein